MLAGEAGSGAALGLVALVARVLAPPGSRSRLSIFIYHRVRPGRDPLFPNEPDAKSFERQLVVLARLFDFLPLGEAVRRLRTNSLPARPACITFDDGYADNAEVALPILRRHRIPATFFVSTGYLDGGRMWNDTIIESVRCATGDTLDLGSIGLGAFAIGTVDERRATIDTLLGRFKYLETQEREDRCAAVCGICEASPPEDLMLRSDQLRELRAAGMELGAHTVSHPILARTPDEIARREIADGRDALNAIADAPVALFAYPNGKPGVDYDARHVAIVRSLGFDAAVSTAWGVATAETDVFQLPRFTPWDKTRARFALRLIENLAKPVRGAPH